MRGKVQLVPDVMPEEPIKGFYGRLARWNGIEARSDLSQIASGAIEGLLSTAAKEVVWLSNLLGYPTDRFIRNHTLVPFAHSLSGERGGTDHFGSESALLQPGSVWFRLGRRDPHFCPSCLAEDITFHGFTYWRREPQLPGRAWCFKHLCALVCARRIDIFDDSPAQVGQRGVQPDHDWVEGLMKSPILHRFFAIQDGLLALKAPLLQAPVSRMLRDRALEAGFHGGRGKVRERLLSAHLREVVDLRWLNEVFPDVGRDALGYFEPIDAATRGHHHASSPSGYAIVAAILWDNPDEALNEMLCAADRDVPRISRPRSQPLAAFHDLEQAYVDARGNHAQVARDLNLPQSSVAASLKALGLPALGELAEPRTVEAAHAFIRRGFPMAEAARLYQVELEDLEALTRRALASMGSALDKLLGRREQIPGPIVPKAPSQVQSPTRKLPRIVLQA